MWPAAGRLVDACAGGLKATMKHRQCITGSGKVCFQFQQRMEHEVVKDRKRKSPELAVGESQSKCLCTFHKQKRWHHGSPLL